MNSNLVISGGASHGWTLWGAYKRTRLGVKLRATAGASIGAVIAAIAACGDIPDYEAEATLKQLTQGNGIVGGAKLVRFHPRLLWARGGGMHDWSYARAALKKLFGNKRMSDTKIPLNIVVGDIYTGTSYVISSNRDPNCLIWEALAASTAVWPIADAQEIPSLGLGNRLFVDGGWGNNIPTEVFESDTAPTIVISLGLPSDISPTPVRRDSFVGVVQGCLDLALWDRCDIPMRQDDTLITINPVGSGFDFDLSDLAIRARVFTGWNAARRLRGIVDHSTIDSLFF